MDNRTQRETDRIFQAILDSTAEPVQDAADVQSFRMAYGTPASQALDGMLLTEIRKTRSGLQTLTASQEEIRDLIEALTAPPYYPAVFLSKSGTDAAVRCGQELSVVNFGQNKASDFEPCDGVLLSNKKNFIVSKSSSIFSSSETAVYQRNVDDKRIVVRSRDEDLVVLVAQPLLEAALKTGDLVRFDRVAGVAYEKIERPKSEAFLEETPAETFASVGGLNAQIADLKRAIGLHFFHPEIVRKYRLPRKKAILLHGPPGTGKTLIAKATANWMAELSDTGHARFINVKPAGLHSMWYGQTESNYREVFHMAREAGESNPNVPVIIFFDEVDSIAAERGHSVNHVDDRVSNAFMAELSGLEDRGNVLVVTATNRLGALDPAMTRPGRLGDLILGIPRPNQAATQQIFERHLPEGIPYAGSGPVRASCINAATAVIFKPTSELVRLLFSDGSARPILASDLINGAGIASIAQSAIEIACQREADGGDAGVGLVDVLNAVGQFLSATARVLTPENCHGYLDDLPQHLEVVNVKRVYGGAGAAFQGAA